MPHPEAEPGAARASRSRVRGRQQGVPAGLSAPSRWCWSLLPGSGSKARAGPCPGTLTALASLVPSVLVRPLGSALAESFGDVERLRRAVVCWGFAAAGREQPPAAVLAVRRPESFLLHSSRHQCTIEMALPSSSGQGGSTRPPLLLRHNVSFECRLV